ncbi:MAG: isochorismate synthase [Synechococcales bacterium]|nr:isochorismate synthase [Synechococcales bacterium]
MPVTPPVSDCYTTHYDLHEFLLACKQAFLATDSIQIVSISSAVDPVDPLAVLARLSQPQQQHFYFENTTQQQSLLAIDSAIHLQLTGPDRFTQARDWVRRLSQQVIQVGDGSLVGASARFFCSFNFHAGRIHAQSDRHFASPETTGSILLPRWQLLRSSDRSHLVANLVVDQQFDPQQQADRVWKGFKMISSLELEALELADQSRSVTPLRLQEVGSASQFRQAVEQALQLIRTGQLDKVVLARAWDVIAASPLDWITCLSNLRQFHPNCYIFSSHDGSGQIFLGASPERLVTLQDQQLETDALAGSAPRGTTAIEDAQLADHLLSSEKETHEHQFVIDFITQRLQRLGLQPTLSQPRLLQLSNIQHLHTPIAATVPPNVHLLDIVAELHPTPAVAGVPRDRACDYIQALEPFERSFYAAPIGWVDTAGNGEFAVGIRSAIIADRTARLFAGAGIVAGSSPDKELAEVEWKLQALLKAIT